MIKNRSYFLVSFLLFISSYYSYAQGILWQETTIPMTEAGDKGLETLLVWPDGPGPHPLAIISHGTARDLHDRKTLSAISFLPTALEFARRGFAVAVVLRRGYGHSGGHFPAKSDLCKGTSYNSTVYEDAKDLHVALDYLATKPQFDMNYVLPVGVSAGGLASLALIAYFPPKGLVGALIFAAGRGSVSDNNVCEEDKLIDTFRVLGKSSSTPMLWVYSVNDHFFNPALAAKFLTAFDSSGGKAILFEAPSYTNEGHYLFSTAGIPVWTPILDNYLKKLALPLFKTMLPLPPVADLVAPQQLSHQGKSAFLDYLKSPPHKGFAVNAVGAYGWISGSYSDEEAQDNALQTCMKYGKGCYLYALNDSLVKKESLQPPEQLSSEGRRAFLNYLKSPSYKAFAVSSRGGYGWISGSSSSNQAQNTALETCAKYANDCHLYAVDNNYYKADNKSYEGFFKF
ncbi:DUF4189 domain-containing protein [Legionella sp. km772]|uniref:DUF4189 domain-containing protein n=1 Tax=Legionella sp. km772 TaxID=2498111 RepID=UPI000F8EF0AF|nr:DUF4189 domain-containing protein [Legionella sp. km772]RUR08593.1 DUF4189 domain-containing protein [Legionella sp. km772]